MRMPPGSKPLKSPTVQTIVIAVIFGILFIIGVMNLSDSPSGGKASESPPFTPPTRELSPQEYAQMTKAEYEAYLRNESGLTEEGIEGSLANFEFNQGQIRRWHEREKHWSSVDAFLANVDRINADGVMTLEEVVQECTTYAHWESRLTAARDYVIEFRQFDPETVKTNNLDDLQDRAEWHLDLVQKTKTLCREQGLG